MSHIVRQLGGMPGCGKTEYIISDMLSKANRYLLALPRKELIAEVEHRLRRQARAGNIPVKIKTVISNGSECQTVERRIQAYAADETCDTDHVILIISHAALIGLDSKQFNFNGRWQLIVDEVPDGAIVGDELYCPIGSSILATIFDLVPVSDGLSKIVPKPAVGHGLLMQDPSTRWLSHLYRRASTVGAYIEADTWDDVAHRKCGWISTWTLSQTTDFASVTMAAAGLQRSLLMLIDPYEVETITLPSRRSRSQGPSVDITFFASDHQASTNFFSRPEGQENLSRIAEYLSRQRVDYWSSNDPIKDNFSPYIHGEYIKPCAAGLNKYSHHTSCAYIYSSKAVPTDEILTRSYPVTRAHIRVAREDEAIIQFIFRGAIRRPDFAGRYRIYLYDGGQAANLQHYLHSAGISTTITHVDLALSQKVERKEKRAPKSPLALEAMAAAKAKKVEADWLRATRTRHPDLSDEQIEQRRQDRDRKRARKI